MPCFIQFQLAEEILVLMFFESKKKKKGFLKESLHPNYKKTFSHLHLEVLNHAYCFAIICSGLEI